MQRVTISLDEAIAASFDTVLHEQGYQTRSEAMRDLIRQHVDAYRLGMAEGVHCVANLSYVYNHRTRALAQRLLDMQHDNHGIVISTTHVILDHASSLETMILKGRVETVRAFADAIQAERGVRFGSINVISVELNDHHEHDHEHHHQGLGHASPATG